jgi:multisubunit Na+/H+ antiporter MnhG subunit
MNIDTKKCSDTGQALTLICLLVFVFGGSQIFVIAAVVVLVVNMVCPIVFRHAAFIWFSLAEILGTVVSRVVLTLVFVLLVIPVGLIRYWIGSDSMRLKEWKKSKQIAGQTEQENNSKTKYNDSVFVERNHLYVPEDIVNPY